MPGLSTALPLAAIAEAAAEDWVNSICFAPDGQRVAAATADGAITVRELAGAERVTARHEQAAVSVTFSVDGRLASGGEDGQVFIDGTSARLGNHWVQALAWRPDGAMLAVAHGRHVTSLGIDTATLAVSAEFPATVACLGWHPRGVQVAAGSYGGVQLMRGNGLAHEQLLSWKGSVLELAIAPDGRRLAHGNQDASVHFWDLNKRSELEMWGYQTKVRQLAWRHDSRLLATGGGDEVTLWDFAGRGPAGRKPLVLAGHDDLVTWLGFAPGSKRLASVAGDGLVLLWLPGETTQPVAALELDAPVTCGAWSADGKRLAVGSAAGQIVVLDADHPR
jgi:WD40 repeat protein